MKIRLTVILLLGILWLLFPGSAMSENETVVVHLPIWAGTASCTAELRDDKGNRLQLLELEAYVTREFVFESIGLGRFTYYVHLIDQDTPEFTYDHRVYTVYVDVIMDAGRHPFYVLTVSRLGVLDPENPTKPDAIRFYNHKYSNVPDRPGVPFDKLPETGYSASKTEVRGRIDYGYTGWTLQIPKLSLITDIVTVPMGETNYEVGTLAKQAGLLEGFELPGEGWSVITGHDHLSETEAGPFALLWDMEIGDRIFVLDPEARLRIFEVFANEKIAEDDVEGLSAIAGTWDRSLTFITCEDERFEGGYANRRIVSAKPIN